MTKKFLYFQPQYVREFVCDGSKCDARCCKSWNIEVDAQTYEQYSRIKPAAVAQEILSHIKFNASVEKYVVDMGAKKICPFLTENKLCRLQLEYGENFLSKVCASFPRSLFNFGKIFERSLSISCPVAAEMILFADEPMKFELVELRKVDDKAAITLVKIDQRLVQRIPESQIAMISILQERTLSIDQRLIVLGFFVDRLNEIFFDVTKEDALTKLVAAYESKKFLDALNDTLEIKNSHRQNRRRLPSTCRSTEKFFASLCDVAGKFFGQRTFPVVFAVATRGRRREKFRSLRRDVTKIFGGDSMIEIFDGAMVPL